MNVWPTGQRILTPSVPRAVPDGDCAVWPAECPRPRSCLSRDGRTLPCLLALGVSGLEGPVMVWAEGISEKVEGHILGDGVRSRACAFRSSQTPSAVNVTLPWHFGGRGSVSGWGRGAREACHRNQSSRPGAKDEHCGGLLTFKMPSSKNRAGASRWLSGAGGARPCRVSLPEDPGPLCSRPLSPVPVPGVESMVSPC